MCSSLSLSRDGWLLFATRFIRLFSYGFLSVGLILYLTEIGFDQWSIGLLFTGTLLGDLVITFILTTMADSLGRKSVLIAGAVLKLFAGLTFGFMSNFYILLFAGTLGVISPTGGEIGPFLAVEQAALTEALKTGDEIAGIFGWYNLLGYLAQALGALSAGATISILAHSLSFTLLSAYRAILIGYSISAIIMLICYLGLSNDIEPLHSRDLLAPRNWLGKFGLHHPESRTIVTKLSLLFIIDSFAGGFVMQTIIAYWFETRFQMDPIVLGSLLMGANVLAGVSALAATPLVKKIGPIHTMVFTHLPSNIFLLLVPLMPNLSSAMVMLLLRFSISQMDVPARQAYVAVVVAPDERSAAGGITNIVRSIGLALSPMAAGHLLRNPNSIMFSLPFIIAGGLKIVYDLLLWFSFKHAQKTTHMGDVLPTRSDYQRIATTDEKPILTNGADVDDVVDDTILNEDVDGQLDAHDSPIASPVKETATAFAVPVEKEKSKKKKNKKAEKTGSIN